MFLPFLKTNLEKKDVFFSPNLQKEISYVVLMPSVCATSSSEVKQAKHQLSDIVSYTYYTYMPCSTLYFQTFL